MEFNSSTFHNNRVFDKFVNTALRVLKRSGPAKLDRLTFIRRGKCSGKLLYNVFEYVFLHGVKKLEAYVDSSRIDTWPVCLHDKNYSFESLTSLKLAIGDTSMISCPFLGPRSGSFKNLTVLQLMRAIITDLDPFSGFPVLETMILVGCVISTEGKALNVHALNLSELTIISYSQKFNYCQLTTPRLRYFDYRGSFEVFLTHDKDLHVCDTMVIGCGSSGPHQKRMFDNLLSLFCTLKNLKSLTLLWSCVEFLSMFKEELVKRTSPFRNLKCLKLDFDQSSSEASKIASDVKAYLLRNSPDAEVAIV